MIELQHHIQKLTNGNYLLDEGQNHGYISGNKLRKFSGILKEQGEVSGFITLGSVFSSHCMTTAFYGAYLQKPVVLIIIGEEEINADQYPHLKASIDFGATVLYVKGADATAFIDQQQERYKDYLWVPGGGHTLGAAQAYCSFFQTLFDQYKALREIKKILLPYGTGTTAFGICQAIHSLNLSIEVIGVSVSRDKQRCLEAAQEFTQSTEELASLVIIDHFAGRYHERSEATESARQRFFVETSLLPDPIYNAKSIEYFYRNEMSNTLIVNTGGMLNNLL